MTRAQDLAAILRVTPPSPFAEALAAGIIADKLVFVQRPFHWVARFAAWRWKCPARTAWLALLMKKPEMAHEILEGAATHCEADGFDEDELNRVEIQLAIIMQAMERATADEAVSA